MPFPLIALQTFGLLKGLPPETLATAGERMHEGTFARRAVVLNKGEPSHALGFLIEGRLQAVDFTLDGREVGIYFVEAGDYFGELSIVDGEPNTEFIISVARSRAAFLPREIARRLMFESPVVAERISTRLARRLRSTASQRRLLGLPSPFQRLCAQLLMLIEHQQSDQPVVHAPPTHQEIAIMIDASRETVTRAFQALQAQRILRRDGDLLRIEDLAQLRAIAEGKRAAPKA